MHVRKHFLIYIITAYCIQYHFKIWFLVINYYPFRWIYGYQYSLDTFPNKCFWYDRRNGWTADEPPTDPCPDSTYKNSRTCTPKYYETLP